MKRRLVNLRYLQEFEFTLRQGGGERREGERGRKRRKRREGGKE